MKKTLLALMAFGLSAFAVDIRTPCADVNSLNGTVEFGMYCVDINGIPFMGALTSKSGTLAVQGPEGDITFQIGAYDVDPFFNWTFTTAVNGVYSVVFVMPYLGGPYGQIASSASGTLTPGAVAVTAKNITVASQVNLGATGQVLALADTTATPPFSGTIPAVNDLQAFVSPLGPGTYGVTLDFEHTGEGSVTINGRIELLNLIPEPATFGLIGVALLGLGLAAHRRRA
jgi:hypothetical protein